jgi:hypothetical protein
MKKNNVIEIIITTNDGKRIAKIGISTDKDFGLKEYAFSIRETLKKTKKTLLDLAIKNELNSLGDEEEGGNGKK